MNCCKHQTSGSRWLLPVALLFLSLGCSEPMPGSNTGGQVNVNIATPLVAVEQTNTPLGGVQLTSAYPFLSAVTMQIFAAGHTTASINSEYNSNRFSMVAGQDAFYLVDSNFTLNVPNDVDVSFLITAYSLSGYQMFSASSLITAAEFSSGTASLPVTMQVDIDPLMPLLASVSSCVDSDGDDFCDLFEDMFARPDGAADVDGDGILNRDDPDSDNDGLPDTVDGLAPSNNGYPSFVHANTPPSVVALELVTTLGTEVIGSAVVSDDDAGDCHSIAIESQPANGSATIYPGAAIDPGNPYSCSYFGVAYTPSPSYSGSDSFTISATDRAGALVTGSVSVTITGVNTPPMAIPQDLSVDEDSPVSITLAGNDPDGSSVAYSVTSAPNSGTLSGSAPNLVYQPNADFNGADSFSFIVNDGFADSAPALVTLSVNPLNDAPVAVNDSGSSSEDTPFTTSNVLTNDSDVEGDSLSVSGADVSSLNGALIVNNSDGTFVYNPPLNFNGSDSFNYTVSDGNGGSATAVVTINVTPVNDAPVAVDDGDRTLLRSSLSSGFVEAQAASAWPSVNGNGRFTAFWSEDATLVPGDSNGVYDLYIRDSQSATTIRATVNDSGIEADDGETDPLQLHPAAISADGRYVIFESRASNLGSLGGVKKELYEYDRLEGVTTPLLDCEGGPITGDSYAPVATPDFSAYAFSSEATDLWPGCFTPISSDDNSASDIYYFSSTLYERRISENASGVVGNDASFNPAISNDGLLVAFASSATNLIAGDTNGVDDIYLKNLSDASVTRISVDSAGKEVTGHSTKPSMSSDGKRIAFVSLATSLVTSDTNGVADIFVHDTGTGTTLRVSVDSTGVEANGASDAPQISKDGRFVVFASLASNLVADDTNGVADIFVHDLLSGQTRRLSDDTQGGEGNGASFAASLSHDGRHVVYASSANSLVASDTNGVDDVFNTTLSDITTVAQVAVSTPDLLLNDSDVDSTFTISSFTPPSNGGVTDKGNGSFDYLPNAGAVGLDAFSYTISDGALSSTAWVWLASETANYAPNAAGDSYTMAAGGPLLILDVLSNDFDVDDDTLTNVVITASPIFGSAAVNPDNTISYTPPTSGGWDSFTYTVSDGVATSNTATVDITLY